MSDIPPKQTVAGTPAAQGDTLGMPYGVPFESAPDAAASPSSGALVSIHAAALHASPDSFPVLKAFQDYLEAERRQARRRVVMLSGFFVALMVVVVTGFLVVGVKLFGHMSRQQDALLQAALANRGTAAAAVAPPPAALPAPEPARAQGPSLPESVGDELRQLRETMALMRRDNERLRAGLDAVSRPTAAPPAATAAKPPASPPAVTPPAAAVVPVPAPAPTPTVTAEARRPPLEMPPPGTRPTPPEGFTDGTLYVPVKGQPDPVPWRVLMPLR